jgi:hypothetical protein
MAILASLLLPFAATAAQAPAAVSPAPAARHRGMFISPMGEPFRTSGHDDDTLSDWFRQADRNHDGRLTLEEMQQDADRFFTLLDVNHDGEIDPDEIAHYETVVAPEISGGPHLELASAEGGGATEGGGRGGGGEHHRRGGGGGHRDGSVRNNNGGESDRGAARFGLLDLPEPVASADTDFNRGVSLAEFREAAGQRFLALDLDHHGYLTLAGLEMIRPAPPPEPNKPDTVNEAEGDSPPGN